MSNHENQSALACRRAAEVAALLGTSKTTIRRLIQAGTLPASRIGRLILIREQDVERLLRENRLDPEVTA